MAKITYYLLRERKVMTKVLVIGADAASWNVIEPLAAQGELPTFRQLMDNGVWGNLRSCIYPFTSPAWKCFSTGKNPGKLGACGWWDFDKVEGKLSLVSSTSFKSRELWDILGDSGYKCATVNMPLTFPPKKINGVFISGAFNPEKGYTYPPTLEKLLRKYNYKVNPVINKITNTDKAILERESIIKNLFFVSKKLLNDSDFDFFQFVVFCTDEIQHYFWRFMEKHDLEYGKVIENFWKLVDSEIGELLTTLKEDYYTFIISDHGATRLNGTFRLNVWLKLKGYFHLKRKRGPSSRTLFATIPKHILPKIRKILPHRVMHKLDRKMFGRLDNVVNTLFSEIDWQETTALCIADNAIHLNADGELEALRNELIDEIRNIRDPKSGEKVVEDVKSRQEVFKGKYLSSLPDLIIIPKEGYRFVGFPRDGGTQDLWDFSNSRISGWHRLDGIILAQGPEIEKGKRINNATIYDIVPTILHILDVPIPQDIDGRVLTEIFQKGSDLKRARRRPLADKKKQNEETQIEREYRSQEEQEIAVERLKELGYL